MPTYQFISSMLRFVAAKTETAAPAAKTKTAAPAAADPRTAAMMAALRRAADDIEAGGGFEVAGDRLELTARALAGFAGFLQKSILPEAVAHGNTGGEAQVRWAVDAAMEAVNTLLSRAALRAGGETGEAAGETVRITLPPPPA